MAERYDWGENLNDYPPLELHSRTGLDPSNPRRLSPANLHLLTIDLLVAAPSRMLVSEVEEYRAQSRGLDAYRGDLAGWSGVRQSQGESL
jgi:hypothetical protein